MDCFAVMEFHRPSHRYAALLSLYLTSYRFHQSRQHRRQYPVVSAEMMAPAS